MSDRGESRRLETGESVRIGPIVIVVSVDQILGGIVMVAVAGILALTCLPLSLMLDEMGCDDAIVCGVLVMSGVLSAVGFFLV